MGNFDATPAGQVTIEVELFFQFQYLVTGIGGALPFGLHARLKVAIVAERYTCKIKSKSVFIDTFLPYEDHSNVKAPFYKKTRSNFLSDLINRFKAAKWQCQGYINEDV